MCTVVIETPSWDIPRVLLKPVSFSCALKPLHLHMMPKLRMRGDIPPSIRVPS